MNIIIGLGNKEKKYELTRHNIGRLTLTSWQKAAGFPDFKLKKKYKSKITETSLNQKKLILVLPETSMNLSGQSVKAILSHYKKPADCLWIVHDDIDIDLGKIKIVKNKGTAGHKGVQSIIDKIKTKNFVRFRIGIKPKTLKTKSLDKFVLNKFTKTEKQTITKAVKKTIKAIEFSLEQGIEKTMNKFN